MFVIYKWNALNSTVRLKTSTTILPKKIKAKQIILFHDLHNLDDIYLMKLSIWILPLYHFITVYSHGYRPTNPWSHCDKQRLNVLILKSAFFSRYLMERTARILREKRENDTATRLIWQRKLTFRIKTSITRHNKMTGSNIKQCNFFNWIFTLTLLHLIFMKNQKHVLNEFKLIQTNLYRISPAKLWLHLRNCPPFFFKCMKIDLIKMARLIKVHLMQCI